MLSVRWSVTAAALVSFLVAPARTAPRPPSAFVGATTCISCHPKQGDTWKTGRHSKMIQPATGASVKGDFSRRELTLGGNRFELRAANGQYFVTESYLTGEARERRVEYTLGSRRIQHYLTTIDKGRIIVLTPSWDVQRREWFDNMEIVRPDQTDGTPVQQWNKNCVGCHVSQQENHYNPATRTYATEWVDFGTACERCHGPGAEHVEAYKGARDTPVRRAPSIVRPTRLDAKTSSAICAQCHSMHDLVAPGYQAGADYYDFFQPVLEYGPRKAQDPAYWADGRPRRFSNDAIGLWQSACFLRGGATCTSCHHDPHLPNIEANPQLAPANDALCTRCHQEISAAPTAHTHHRAGSSGSSCVECHMPKAVVSIKATMRDHTMSLPAPENTIAHATPNACTDCHTDRTPAWAVDVAKQWWPADRRLKMVARADLFTSARAQRPDALDKLVATLANPAEPPLVRANAAGYLAAYDNARSLQGLLAGARADHPAVRSVAISSLGRLARQHGEARPALIAALRDPQRAVRIAALASIVNAGGGPLDPRDEQQFRRVGEELAERAAVLEDDAGAQRDLGLTKLLTAEFDAAATALQISADLDPDASSTRFLLALARLGQGRLDLARTLLKRVPKSDPYYASAQERLKGLGTPRN